MGDVYACLCFEMLEWYRCLFCGSVDRARSRYTVVKGQKPNGDTNCLIWFPPFQCMAIGKGVTFWLKLVNCFLNVLDFLLDLSALKWFVILTLRMKSVLSQSARRKSRNKHLNFKSLFVIIVSGMHGHKNIPSANPLFSGIIMSSTYSPH